MYHAEEAQEDFLVLSGECLLIVEGRSGSSVPGTSCTAHRGPSTCSSGPARSRAFAGGRRARKGRGLRYPVNETALEHGAGVEEETSDPSVAYARFAEDKPISCPEEFPPG